MQLFIFQYVSQNKSGNNETLITLFLKYIAVGVQTDLFALIGAPQSFDKDIVTPDAFALVAKAARHRDVCNGNIYLDPD